MLRLSLAQAAVLEKAIARRVARKVLTLRAPTSNEQAAERTAVSIAQLSGPEIAISGTGISPAVAEP